MEGSVSERGIGRRRAIPVLHVVGSHYDVGFDAGRNFESMIKSFLATFESLRNFEKEYKTESGRQAYDKTLANMKKRYPHYVKEIQGIADGAKVPFHQLFLLHMDDIIGSINDNVITKDTGGCSSVGFNTPQSCILGHTEDALAETENHFYILKAHVIPTPEDSQAGAVEERFASVCYAGQLPGYTSGYNEHGLVFSVNTLSPKALKPGGTPRTFITRALLATKNYDEAERVILDQGLGIGNGFSLNMIWEESGNRELRNIEIAPNFKGNQSQLDIQKYESTDVLVHCNKYQRLKVSEVNGLIIDSSSARLATIHGQDKPRCKHEVENILSNTSGKEYRVFEDRATQLRRVKTICAGIFDLDQKTWSVYIERPNSSEPVAVLPIVFNCPN